MNNTHFVSDLHLFSQRSSAPLWEPTIRSAVMRSDTFVLGGDIFDFRWSTQGSIRHAVADSIDWLQRLIDVNPNCQFHYVLGNHDCHPRFVDALQRTVESVPQLSWHRHWIQLGETVFLHGDIVDTRVGHGESHHDVLDARRLAGEMRRPPNRVSHALYDAAVQMRAHRVIVHLAKRREVVLNRLTQYLLTQNCSKATGVRQVYFGHTHRKLNAVPHAGMLFYNPGAAIKGLPFQMLNVRSGS